MQVIIGLRIWQSRVTCEGRSGIKGGILRWHDMPITITINILTSTTICRKRLGMKTGMIEYCGKVKRGWRVEKGEDMIRYRWVNKWEWWKRWNILVLYISRHPNTSNLLFTQSLPTFLAMQLRTQSGPHALMIKRRRRKMTLYWEQYSVLFSSAEKSTERP